MNCIIRETVCMGWEHVITFPTKMLTHTVQNYTIQIFIGTDNGQMSYWSLLSRTLEWGKDTNEMHFVAFCSL